MPDVNYRRLRNVRYAIHVPTGETGGPSTPWPMIVFLHGRGECGTDGRRQLTAGLWPHIAGNPAMRSTVVLLPQKEDPGSEWEDSASLLDEMIRLAVRNHPIDERRISLTGMSQGGHGVWTINAVMPGRFSALAPVCGYAERRFLPGSDLPFGRVVEPGPLTDSILAAACHLPVWLFHGERDMSIPSEESRRLAAGLRNRAGRVTLTLYHDLEHNSWDRAYSQEGLIDWLISHRRA